MRLSRSLANITFPERNLVLSIIRGAREISSARDLEPIVVLICYILGPLVEWLDKVIDVKFGDPSAPTKARVMKLFDTQFHQIYINRLGEFLVRTKGRADEVHKSIHEILFKDLEATIETWGPGFLELSNRLPGLRGQAIRFHLISEIDHRLDEIESVLTERENRIKIMRNRLEELTSLSRGLDQVGLTGPHELEFQHLRDENTGRRVSRNYLSATMLDTERGEVEKLKMKIPDLRSFLNFISETATEARNTESPSVTGDKTPGNLGAEEMNVIQEFLIKVDDRFEGLL